ncbi:MAG: terminase small subunit [Clostridiaceae bacterium]
MAKLTKKQQAFIDEYLIDLNATQASIRAGYSTATAGQMGDENLKKPQIKSEIEKMLAERSKRTGINQDRIVLELAKIALMKMTDIVDPKTGEIRYDATDEDLACIESIKVKTIPTKSGMGTEREVKMASKMKAIELLGKHLGMWSDKLDLTVQLPIVISGEDELED